MATSEPTADASPSLADLRAKLHGALDALTLATVKLSKQLSEAPQATPASVRLIQAHARDECDDFATAAFFISLRLQSIVPDGSSRDNGGSGGRDRDVREEQEEEEEEEEEEDKGEERAAAVASLRLLTRCTEVMDKRLQWALHLQRQAVIDEDVLAAYSFEASEHSSPWAAVRAKAYAWGRSILRHKRGAAAACLLLGVVSATWVHMRRVVPLKAEQRALRDIQSMSMLPHLPPPPHAQASASLRDAAIRDASRTATVCGSMATVVSGATAVAMGAHTAVVDSSSPLALTSEFLAKLTALRQRCRSAHMSTCTAVTIHEDLKECFELLHAYMSFTDLRQCAICRELVTPKDVLVRFLLLLLPLCVCVCVCVCVWLSV